MNRSVFGSALHFSIFWILATYLLLLAETKAHQNHKCALSGGGAQTATNIPSLVFVARFECSLVILVPLLVHPSGSSHFLRGAGYTSNGSILWL